MGNRVPITDRIVKKVPMMSWHLSRELNVMRKPCEYLGKDKFRAVRRPNGKAGPCLVCSENTQEATVAGTNEGDGRW